MFFRFLAIVFFFAPFAAFAAASPLSHIDFDWQDAATLIIFSLTLLSIALEVRPPEISMLLGVIGLVILGIIDTKEFLAGFSYDLLLTIAMLCVIVRAVEVNGLLDILAKNVLAQSKGYKASLLSLMLPVGVASAFLNNTPVVLLFTPMVRQWAKGQGFIPSKFLIPLSYAAIMGGMCTIMGTSTNLVIEGLVREASPDAHISFFELSFIGIPVFVFGVAYLLLFGNAFLPKREDPISKAELESRNYTAEFQVEKGSALAAKTLREARSAFFRSEMVVQIERSEFIIDSPSEDMVIVEGDRLVFAGDINHIAELHRIKGLRSLADPHFTLDSASSHFAEIVISSTSSLIGKTLRQVRFRTQYGASCLAIYRQGERIAENVGEVPLFPGDVLILLSSDHWEHEELGSKEFYSVGESRRLKIFEQTKAALVLSVLAGFVCFAVAGFPLSLCAVTAAALFIGLGLISIEEAKNSIVWDLLLLIACAFGMAKAIVKTGLAASLASAILGFVGTDPHFVIGGILLTAILSTEFLSNNAAALILFPIGINIAHLAGYSSPESIKAVGIALAIGCSAGFALPIGYQTHLIVYSQGGYKFTDFLRAGLLLDVLVLLLGSLLIPLIWPLV